MQSGTSSNNIHYNKWMSTGGIARWWDILFAI